MFPLFTKAFPSSGPELSRLLTESLQRLFILTGAPVSIREKSYPDLEELDISLDGAQLRPDPPRAPALSPDTLPGFHVDRLKIMASPLSIGPATIHLALNASGVRFGQRKDAQDQLVLSVEAATDGKLHISTTPANLEAAIAAMAKQEAAKQGVVIDAVHLTLRQKGDRSVAAEVQLRARKLFLSASIRINGELDCDEHLNARISGLKCSGDGAIATLACGILGPHLRQLDGREFSLLSLPLGEIRLRDLQLTVGERLAVTAEFGSQK